MNRRAATNGFATPALFLTAFSTSERTTALIPNGHPVDQFTVVPDPMSLGTKAVDSFRRIPAVGRAGLPGILQPCVGTFAEQLGLSQTSGVTGH